jgi:iron complex transport system permease protein
MIGRKYTLLFAFAGLLTLTVALISLLVGSYPLTVADMRSALGQITLPREEQAMSTRVFLSLRLPRTVTALLSGAVLGVCGGVYQMIFRSPLASPDLTGVSSGASLGAALAIVLGIGAAPLRMGFAFAGGMLSLVLVLLLVRAAGGERLGTYILAGIVISSVAEAGLMVLKTVADPERQLAAIDFWTMGSLAAVSSSRMLPMLAVSLPALILLLILRRPVLMLSLGNEESRAMGLSPDLWRGILLTLATLAVSATVSVTGVIGFVGLIAPHVARLLCQRRSGAYLLLCGMLGAILLTVADLCARSVGGGAELPLSIFTVAAGVPVLIVLLCRGGRRRI